MVDAFPDAYMKVVTLLDSCQLLFDQHMGSDNIHLAVGRQLSHLRICCTELYNVYEIAPIQTKESVFLLTVLAKELDKFKGRLKRMNSCWCSCFSSCNEIPPKTLIKLRTVAMVFHRTNKECFKKVVELSPVVVQPTESDGLKSRKISFSDEDIYPSRLTSMATNGSSTPPALSLFKPAHVPATEPVLSPRSSILGSRMQRVSPLSKIREVDTDVIDLDIATGDGSSSARPPIDGGVVGGNDGSNTIPDRSKPAIALASS